MGNELFARGCPIYTHVCMVILLRRLVSVGVSDVEAVT